MSRRGTILRKTAWIWLMGAVVWATDSLIAAHFHAAVHARISFFLAALFSLAWMFYRAQK